MKTTNKEIGFKQHHLGTLQRIEGTGDADTILSILDAIAPHIM